MSADEIRQAAETLRERASGVDPGPWERGDNIHGVVVRVGSNWPTGDDDAVTSTDSFAMAGYVATMHPGVALALADWLDETSERHGPVFVDRDDRPWCNYVGCYEMAEAFPCPDAQQAITVARLINGATS